VTLSDAQLSDLKSLSIDGDFIRGDWPSHPKHKLAECMYRLGKKAAGRLLDGKEHNGMPE